MRNIPLQAQLEIACAIDRPKLLERLVAPYGALADISSLLSFTADDLYRFLRENPHVCRQLFNDAGDKRWAPATFIDRSFFVYEVGWYENGRKSVQWFLTLAAAVTDYVLASLNLPRFQKKHFLQ